MSINTTQGFIMQEYEVRSQREMIRLMIDGNTLVFKNGSSCEYVDSDCLVPFKYSEAKIRPCAGLSDFWKLPCKTKTKEINDGR